MTVNEWLRRLNLNQYAPKFRKDGIKRVSDLKYVDERSIDGFGIEALVDRKRIMDMIQGKENAKLLFALQTRA